MNCTWRAEHKDGHWYRIFLTILAFNHENKLLPPRTKKNDGRVTEIRMKDGRTFNKIMPGSAYSKWERACIRSMKLCFSEMRTHGLWEITDFMNCEAKIFFKGPEGDTVGYQQAIGDMLQVSELIKNDRQIESWDGSARIRVKEWPRLEICLTYLWPGGTKKAKRAPRRIKPALSIQTGLPIFDQLGNTQE